VTNHRIFGFKIRTYERIKSWMQLLSKQWMDISKGGVKRPRNKTLSRTKLCHLQVIFGSIVCSIAHNIPRSKTPPFKATQAGFRNEKGYRERDKEGYHRVS